ncbi:leucine carboxyl methyltransferase 1-like [Watersipora subatra]|uniref:leucine carboxyl methyltransferase 1-like n=1 Tax=Watersipora subatra TaxID=2589382 RepID=UPI00355B5A50
MACANAQLTDNAVTSTNDDATCSKSYAVSLGYWVDPYIKTVCKQTIKKTPEINRGYFARVYAVRALVEGFINTHQRKCQVVSLGAGYDTLFWNLKDHGLLPVKYVEIDIATVTRQKTFMLLRKPGNMLEALGEEVEVLGVAKLGIQCPHYALLPADLRNTNELDKQLQAASLDFQLPTLVLVECVLMYLPEDDSNRLLGYLAQKFSHCHLVNYDVTNMSDRFAQVMLENLGSRQCPLHIQDCVSDSAQMERLKRSGWMQVSVKDMNNLYNTSIPHEQRTRIEKIEMLDEVHLLSELLKHYCICIASNTQDLDITCASLTSSIS